MVRREFLNTSIGVASLALIAADAPASEAERKAVVSDAIAALPQRDRIKVAFMLGEGANVIDTMGPWEVFQDTSSGGMNMPFELFTVAPTMEVVNMTGGLRVVPHHSVDTAPQPQVIVVPAHRSTERSREWLKSASAGTDVTTSVCTGAFQLARVGLLDGLAATTHHDFWDAFAAQFPRVELRRGMRFVDSGSIATAGGLTSGIDMALHIVMRYFGAEVAATTARYMEHESNAWRSGGVAG